MSATAGRAAPPARPARPARRGDIIIVRLDERTPAAVIRTMCDAFVDEYAKTGVRFLVLMHGSTADVAAADDLTAVAQHWLDDYYSPGGGDRLERIRDLCIALGATP